MKSSYGNKAIKTQKAEAMIRPGKGYSIVFNYCFGPIIKLLGENVKSFLGSQYMELRSRMMRNYHVPFCNNYEYNRAGPKARPIKRST